MNKRLLVLLDVDGILADFVGGSLEMIERRLGRSYRPEQVTTWDFTSLPEWESIKDRYWELVRSIGFCAGLPVIPGALEGVARIREFADVEFLTSPMHGSPTWVHERDSWLERHFGAHHRDVMHVRKKQRVRGDVLVDDSPENVEAWRAAHPEGLGILWTRPYNVAAQQPRVADWDSLVRVLECLGRDYPTGCSAG